jgi:chromosome partitioning protein
MSLTQSIALNEDGNPFKDFTTWYDRSVRLKKTVFDALEEFTGTAQFNFSIDYDFIYRITKQYHFIPSVQDLYWTELDVFDRERVRYFIPHLLEKIQGTKGMPDYDYCLFDCPPSFSLLSYSVLSCCDMLLAPVNPDFFAARGLSMLLSSLKLRIEPFPIPRIGVVMNKARKPGGSSDKVYSKETLRYLEDMAAVLKSMSRDEDLKTRLFHTTIPDRAGMRRAIQEGMPDDIQTDFYNLWKEITEFVDES